jgi:hypothetical protein
MNDQGRGTMEEIRQKARQRAQDLPSMEEVERRAVEALRVAERTPTTAYMIAVFASMMLSLILLMSKKTSLGIFVGLWPPTILSLLPLMRERRLSREAEMMRQNRGPQELMAE